jgi:hypothetical protein
MDTTMHFFNILIILLLAQFFQGTEGACLRQDEPVVQCDVNFLETNLYDVECPFVLNIDPTEIDRLYGLPGKNHRSRFAQWKITKNVIPEHSMIAAFDRDRTLKKHQYRIFSCTTEFPIRI